MNNSSNVFNENDYKNDEKHRGGITLYNAMVSSIENDNGIKESVKDIEIPKLRNKVKEYQNMLKIYFSNRDKFINNIGKLSLEEQKIMKIGRWYDWEKSNSYKSTGYKPDKDKEDLLNKFKNDEYYYFKDIIEALSRELVNKFLRENLKNLITNRDIENLKTYMTSDSDDVYGGVDLIIEIKENGVEIPMYLGVDVAVSDNEEYLSNKKLKTETYCKEFNQSVLENKYNVKKEDIEKMDFKDKKNYKDIENMKIKRKVLVFERSVMRELFLRYLEKQETKGPRDTVDILEIYRQIMKEKHNKDLNYKTIGLEDLQKNTSSGINDILTIN